MGWIRGYFNKDRLPKPPSDRTEEIVGKYLDHEFVVFPMADRNAELEELAIVGEKYSVAFPAEFASHVCGRFPGVYVEVKETVWPRPKPSDVGPFWSFRYGLHTSIGFHLVFREGSSETTRFV